MALTEFQSIKCIINSINYILCYFGLPLFTSVPIFMVIATVVNRITDDRYINNQPLEQLNTIVTDLSSRPYQQYY